MCQQALKEAQDKHQQESDRRVRQNEDERDEYIARLDALSARLAEADDRSSKNESHLSLVIKDLSAAFDRKRSEHAHVLADLEVHRDLSERQANELREIETHHRELQDLSERQANELREIETHQRELQADVCRKVATIDDLNREIVTTIDDLNRQINAHKQQVEHLHAVLVDRDQQKQAVMTHINAVYASRSWRITRPLRVAMRFFSKLRNVPSSG
jgi:chromosome segregation ATPase